MSAVTTIAPHHASIEAPTELRALPGWLLWRYKSQPGTDKPLKVPYYTEGGRRHGKQGSPEDRAKLTTFAAAKAAAARRGMSGVGLAILPDWGITALDFDKCVGPDGALPPEVERIVMQTYAEYSPSGTGIRAFVRGNLGDHKSQAKDGEYGFETFSGSGFVTFTGNLLPAHDLLGLEDYIDANPVDAASLCKSRFGEGKKAESNVGESAFDSYAPKIGLSQAEMFAYVEALDPDLSRDEWIRVGMALHHETDGSDDGFLIWDGWSGMGGKYPSEEALRNQWDSFSRRSGGQKVTMASVMQMAKRRNPALFVEAATAQELKAVAAEAKTEAPPAAGKLSTEAYNGKFPIWSAAALVHRKAGDWLIKGVIPQADLVVLYGASTAGKSFIALDMGMAIARGVPWRGHRVKQARVIYIGAEGGAGVGKRIQAYCEKHDVDPNGLDFGVIIAAPNFMLKEDISDIVAAISDAGGCGLLIVDTFAQVTPGANENSAESMGLALANARALREATGAVVKMVHHAGKDASKGSRGWSGIKAAADAEIEVLREENGARQIKITKMKDGDDGLSWGFKLGVVEVGLDNDGDPITSCVVEEAEVPAKAASDKNVNGRVKADQYRGPVEKHVEDMAALSVANDTDMAKFVQHCADTLPLPEDGKRDRRLYRVNRAVHSLTKVADPPFYIKDGKICFLK